MAQQATNIIPPTGIGAIGWQDIVKGAITTSLTSLLSAAYLLLQDGKIHGWIEFKPYMVAAVASGIAYLIKNISTNNVGQFLAKDKPVVHVDVEELKDLKNKAAVAEGDYK